MDEDAGWVVAFFVGVARDGVGLGGERYAVDLRHQEEAMSAARDHLWEIMALAIDNIKRGLVVSDTQTTIVSDGPKDNYLVVVTVVKR